MAVSATFDTLMRPTVDKLDREPTVKKLQELADDSPDAAVKAAVAVEIMKLILTRRTR